LQQILSNLCAPANQSFFFAHSFFFARLKKKVYLGVSNFSEHKKRIPHFQRNPLNSGYFSKDLFFFLLTFFHFEGLRDIEDPGHQEPVEFFFIG